MLKDLILFLTLILSFPVSGQVPDRPKENPNGNSDIINKTNLVALQKDYINKLYYNIIAAPKEIINGEEYLFYFFQSKTNPLFYSREKFNSTLFINNRQYNNVKIQYDTYLDELIYTDTSRIINFEFPRIALNKDIIEGFILFINGESINFRHLRFGEKRGEKIEDGYYEVVYEGPTKYIIRHRSVLYRDESLNEYKYSPVHYVSAGDGYYDIKNKKNFILIFGNRSEEIKGFLRKSKMRLKRADKSQIVELLKYYDSLKTT